MRKKSEGFCDLLVWDEVDIIGLFYPLSCSLQG